MADRYWVAPLAASWNSTANWSTTSGGVSGASVPGAADKAIFDNPGGLFNGNCTLDISPTVDGMEISGYTATMDFNGKNLTIDNTQWLCSSAATITMGSGAVTAHSVNFTAGTITATSGTWKVGSGGGSVFTIGAGVTFAHGSGTITYETPGGTITIDGKTLNNFTLDTTNPTSQIILGASFTIAGTFIFVDTTLTGAFTVTLLGNLDVRDTSGSTTSTTIYEFAGSGTQNITSDGTRRFLGAGGLKFNHTGTVVFESGKTFVLRPNGPVTSLLWVQGAVTTTGSVIEFTGFDHTLNDTNTQYNELHFNHNNPSTGVTVTGTFKLTTFRLTGAGGFTGGTIEVIGDMISTYTGTVGGTTVMTLNGTGTQNISSSGATVNWPGGTITINKASGTTFLTTGACTFDTSGQDLVLQAGTLDLNGFDLETDDLITISGGTLTLGAKTARCGRYTQTSGTININTGVLNCVCRTGTVDIFSYTAGTINQGTGTLRLEIATTGTANYKTNAASLTIHHLEIRHSGTGARIVQTTAGDTWTVNGNLLIASPGGGGIQMLGAATINLKGNMSITAADARGSSQILTVNGTVDQEYTVPVQAITGTNRFPRVKVNKASGSLKPAAGNANWASERLEIEVGTFIAPTSGIVKVHNLDAGTVTVFSITAGAVFTHANSTLGLSNGTTTSVSMTMALPADTEIGALAVHAPSATGANVHTWTITGGTLTVKGMLTINARGALAGTAKCEDGVAHNGTGGALALTFQGAALQAASGTSWFTGAMTVNKTGNFVRQDAAITAVDPASLTCTLGEWCMNGFNLDVVGTADGGGIGSAALNKKGGTLAAGATAGNIVDAGTCGILGGGKTFDLLLRGVA